MMRAFLRSLKINARRGERKLIVFIAGIRRIYWRRTTAVRVILANCGDP